MTSINETKSFVWRASGLVILFCSLAFYGHQQILKPSGHLHSNDFKHIYLGSRMLDMGQDPYDAALFLKEASFHGFTTVLPYVYLPFTGLVLRPLAQLEFPRAVKIFFGLNHFLALASVWLMASRKRGDLFPREAFWILYLAIFFPLTRNSTAGQLNVILLFCYALIGYLDSRRLPPAVGALTAFAALFKLSPGILFLYFAWTRQWKNLKWSFAFLFLFMGISFAFSGWAVHKNFFPVMRQMSYGRSTWEEFGHDFYRDPFNQSLNSFFHHIMTDNPHTSPWIPLGARAANSFTIMVSLIILAAALTSTRRAHDGNPSEEAGESYRKSAYAIFIMLSLLIPSLCWDHYFVQALLPMAFLLEILYDRKLSWRLAVAAAAFFFLGIPWMFPADSFRHGPGILLMSLKLWAGLVVFILLVEQAFRLGKKGACQWAHLN